MKRGLVLMVVLAALPGCQRPAAVVDPCRRPVLVQHQSLATYAGQRERIGACIKRAAYDLARAGGPLEAVAKGAMARCASEEADVIAALRKDGPVWPWERVQIHGELAHVASLSAAQARSIGCGGPPDTH